MDFTGYIEYNNRIYTFHYQKHYLTLITTNPNEDSKEDWFYGWNQFEKVDYFRGVTSDGFEIYFYVEEKVVKRNGTYRCCPKIIIISKDQDKLLSNTKYKTLKFKGGMINRFYSNRIIFDKIDDNLIDQGMIKFKDLDLVTKSEKIFIDNKKALFEVSINHPGWIDDGSIKIGSVDSIIRLIYIKEWKVEELLNSVLKMRDLLFFCSNRRYFEFNKVCLEIQLENGKYKEQADIYIPSPEDMKEPKHMLEYSLIQGKINKLLRLINNIRYITYKIPRDDSEYKSVTASSYANTFSAFESVYNYCNKKDTTENKVFIEVKEEILNELNKISNKYYKKDRSKRKIIKRYIGLVEKKTDFILETSIINELKKHINILESLPDQKYKDILQGHEEEIIIDAVESRDLITHEDVFAPSDADIAVYLVLQRLIHILILEKIGLNQKKVDHIIEFLSHYEIL